MPDQLGASTPEQEKAIKLNAALTCLEQLQAQGYFLHDREGRAIDHEEYMTAIQTALDAALAASPSPPETQDKDRWTLDNIFTVARREQRRVEAGKPLRLGMLGHILRLCEAVGCQSRAVGVLREAPPETCAWREDDYGYALPVCPESAGVTLWIEKKRMVGWKGCPYCLRPLSPSSGGIKEKS